MSNSADNSILIVDDEELNLEILNAILCREYTIHKTTKGASVAELAAKYMPDIILLDIIMPDLNGFEALRALKSSEETRKIPVIIITGLNSDEDEEMGLALGAVDFIHKPFSAKVVSSRIRFQVQMINQIRALENYTRIQASINASEEKSKFFARMSHEMRTPLNAVIGFSELTLEAGGLSREARENVEIISNAGASLLGLVNDILDISKLESGNFKLVPAEYETPALINDAIDQCIIRKGEKPIEFRLNIDENLPNSLIGDDLRVKQILNNLLSNAFKYTKKGVVELGVICESMAKYGEEFSSSNPEDAILLTVSVKDTGVGIKNEDIDKLFSDYARVELSSNKKIEGTGLGLPITKMMVELMGGRILVESEYGTGSIFTARIKQQYVTDEVIGANAVNSLRNFNYSDHRRRQNFKMTRRSLPYARVLVVDDVLPNLEIAKGMMKPYRMQVDCMSSGKQAVNAVREEKVKYNAIFMDHMMPEMDGIEATRIIREEINTDYARNVPIIAFTANAITGNEEMFLSKGFQDFVSKPIDLLRLDAVIMQWVHDEEFERTQSDRHINVNGKMVYDLRSGNDRRSGKIDRRTGYDRRRISRSIKKFNINSATERLGGDWETCLQVIQSFSSNTEPVLETIREVNAANLPNYAITVHGIKSTCRGICAENEGKMAEALEMASKAGNLDFVKANNQAFIEAVSALIAEINNAFAENTRSRDKPKKDKPYTEVLQKLAAACGDYKATEIIALMEEIDVFDYTNDNGLVSWLRDNIKQMNFLEVADKLSGS